MKDKTDRLFEIIDHPECFSDPEIHQVLDDPDSRALYSSLCKTADALTGSSEPDIDKEWAAFALAHALAPATRRHSFAAFIRRYAAAAIIFALASIAVVAATISFRSTAAKQQEQAPVDSATSSPESTTAAQTPALTPESSQTVVFKNQTFADIIAAITEYYGLGAVYKSESAKELRLYFQWDRTLGPEETIDQLDSFEQINITLTDSILTID